MAGPTARSDGQGKNSSIYVGDLDCKLLTRTRLLGGSYSMKFVLTGGAKVLRGERTDLLP